MLRRTLLLVSLLTAVQHFSVVAAEPTAADAQLENVIAEYWEYYLEENPDVATKTGVSRMDRGMGPYRA